jgi:hypothetical protein
MSYSDHKHRYVIDASKSWHRAWWAEQLGITEDELIEAMLAVGPDADAVAAFISTMRRTCKPNHSARKARYPGAPTGAG